ncbi:MAG: alpha/beta hydrolase fold domain-containing protein, partial [bacterium]|nr:alpha/beta hydrolase fold domain-containing protein [bacterium]
MQKCFALRLIASVIMVLDLTVASGSLVAAEPSAVIDLWPAGQEPGPTRVQAELGERKVTDRRRTFDQLTNIAVPQLAVFPAPQSSRTGAAVLVLPGGGMQRLAYEHEGVEIANWLNPKGISVFVLKYRVPGPASTALLDAQRAMGIIRNSADDFAIDPDRICVMGFSAGGEVALLLATNHEQRGYAELDAADRASCRPNSVCLVYPGGIVSRAGELRSEIKDKLDAANTPPMFLVHAFSDASLNSLALAIELKLRKIPAELHVYELGGHGFGARDSALPLGGWKSSFLEWVRWQGFMDPPYVSPFADNLHAAWLGADQSETLSRSQPSATLEDAYAIQRVLVRKLAASANDPIAGFKAGYATRESQAKAGLTGPMTGILLRSGILQAEGPIKIASSSEPPLMIETELGFRVSEGLDISTRIANEKQIKGAFEAVAAVIELPRALPPLMHGELKAVDTAAANIGAHRVLIGQVHASPDDFQPESLKIRFSKDGELL